MWMELPASAVLCLRPTPSHGLLPSRRQVIPFSLRPKSSIVQACYGPSTGLLSSAPDFGRDRRDLDHRRPRRGGAIRQSPAGGARAPVGADPEAARPGARRSRGIARYRALYAAREDLGGRPEAKGPRLRPPVPSVPRAGFELFQAYLGAETTHK